MVAGPMSREALELLLDCKIPMQFMRGNADRAIAAQMLGEDIGGAGPESVRGFIVWVAQQLDSQHLNLISGWPETLHLHHRRLGEVLFCHATHQTRV
jgi:hypothetical protein